MEQGLVLLSVLESVADRVFVGAAWLDMVYPGWERKVDLSQLRMHNGRWCILGQVVSSGEIITVHYAGGSCKETGYDAAIAVAAHARLSGESVPTLSDLGFDLLIGWSGWTRYALLAEAWTAIIKHRFDTGTLSDSE